MLHEVPALCRPTVADDDGLVLQPTWPSLPPEARHGLAGEFLSMVSPHTEADEAALLTSLLAVFGAVVGGRPHAMADGAEHPARIWPLIVGATSKARKGSSAAQVLRAAAAVDPAFVRDRVLAGFGSGEALVDAVAGDQDGRLLVLEPEFARILAISKREGSVLSVLLRQAWDGGRLQVRSRAATSVADGAHVVVIGHITQAELLAKMADSDAWGGSLNRFLIVGARRSQLLPSGGNLDDRDVADFGRKVAYVATHARGAGLVRRTPPAERYWAELYEELAADDPGGILGAVVARDAAQVLRLSVTYCLLDGARQIDIPHIQAARAVWDYSRASAALVFGERTGDAIADRILTELQASGAQGLTGTAVRDLFDRHAKRDQLERATALLVEKGLATKATKSTTRGRPLTVLRLATKATKATEVRHPAPCPDEPELDYDEMTEGPPDDETLARWADEATRLGTGVR